MNIRRKLVAYLLRPFKIGNITFAYDVQGEKCVHSKTDMHIPTGCIFSGTIQFGKYSTIGPRCFFRGNIEIGNYCQFGAEVSFHSRNHPIEHLSTYQNARLFDGKLKELRSDSKISVGNDVWMGHGAIILSGVTIGHGAIIAAGAVIRKDVEPFSIVAGVPGKHIRFRFSEKSRKEIMQMKWWDLEPHEITALEDKFFKKYK